MSQETFKVPLDETRDIRSCVSELIGPADVATATWVTLGTITVPRNTRFAVWSVYASQASTAQATQAVLGMYWRLLRETTSGDVVSEGITGGPGGTTAGYMKETRFGKPLVLKTGRYLFRVYQAGGQTKSCIGEIVYERMNE